MLEVPMHWVIELLLVALLGSALAQEDTSTMEERLEPPDATHAYDETILRFNSNAKAFASWDAFQAEVLSKIAPDTMGRCYALTGRVMQPVRVTRIALSREAETGWQQTPGHGWRHEQADRTFIEYRVNEKAGVLLRLEGVKPRFFFAQTRQVCEFPLLTATP
jgi:hypothetical protein